MNVRKHVVKPMLITFGILLVLLAVVITVLHFFFPLTMSNLCYKLGMNNATLQYLEKSYDKTKNYNQLYSMVNLSIKVNNSEKLVVYYEEFSKNSQYNNFVANIDAQNAEQNVSALIKSKLFSEDNYLKNRYVVALIKNNKLQEAYNYAMQNFNENISFDVIPPYLFTNVLVENNLDTLSDLNVISSRLESYFDNCVNSFNNNFSVNSNVVKLLVLGGRINEVASNLKALSNFNEQLITKTQENINEIVREINSSMAMLV